MGKFEDEAKRLVQRMEPISDEEMSQLQILHFEQMIEAAEPMYAEAKENTGADGDNAHAEAVLVACIGMISTLEMKKFVEGLKGLVA